MSLQSRLEKLEAAMGAGNGYAGPVLFVRFVDADGSCTPAKRFRQGDTIVEIHPGETEANFCERAKNEAIARRLPGCLNGIVFFPVFDSEPASKRIEIANFDDDTNLETLATRDLGEMAALLRASLPEIPYR